MPNSSLFRRDKSDIIRGKPAQNRYIFYYEEQI